MIRVLAAALLLALPAAAGAATETIRVGPDVGNVQSSETVLKRGTTYTIRFGGIIRIDYPYTDPASFKEIDPLYCVRTTNPQLAAECEDADAEIAIYAKQAGYDLQIANDATGSKVQAYSADHQYVFRWKAPADGRLTLGSDPPYTPPDHERWSGAFTVSIEQFGTGGTCSGREATITATDDDPTGANRIVGTKGPDVIVGTPGNDIILGGGGADTICAGGGNDHVDGGGASDIIGGGKGNDVLVGGAGEGADRLVGGADNDDLRGGAGIDELRGGAGNDTLDSGPYVKVPDPEDDSDERLDGGPDDDRYIARHANVGISFAQFPGPVRVDLTRGRASGQGSDTIVGHPSIYGTKRADRLIGGPHDDFLVGYGGDDIIIGRGGNDVIYGSEGNDTVDGGPGHDRCSAEKRINCEAFPLGG